jgi:hypothetical protein
MNTPASSFEVGRTYYTRSICDHECIYQLTVVGRTACTVRVNDHRGTNRTLRVFMDYDNVEAVKPNGTYSMCAVIRANKQLFV